MIEHCNDCFLLFSSTHEVVSMLGATKHAIALSQSVSSLTQTRSYSISRLFTSPLLLFTSSSLQHQTVHANRSTLQQRKSSLCSSVVKSCPQCLLPSRCRHRCWFALHSAAPSLDCCRCPTPLLSELRPFWGNDEHTGSETKCSAPVK